MTEKIRYELDPHNRLIAEPGTAVSGLSQFRYIIDGELKIGNGNALFYHVKSPARGLLRQLNLPYQLKLRGTWSLTENYDLKLTLDKCQLAGFRNEIVLKGEIIGAKSDALLFSITQKTTDDTVSTRILKLEGTWQADKENRLAFKAYREDGKYDTLTFESTWEVGKNHQVVYKYRKNLSEKNKKAERSLAFDGFWNINRKNILTYHLDFINRSLFDFRVGCGRADKDSIKYEVGVGFKKKRRPVREYIVLYGRWNLQKGIGLVFEINYGKNQIGGIVFGAEARLKKGARLELNLKTEAGRPLGMSLTLSKEILGGEGELYSKALFSEKEKAVYIGAGFRW